MGPRQKIRRCKKKKKRTTLAMSKKVQACTRTSYEKISLGTVACRWGGMYVLHTRTDKSTAANHVSFKIMALLSTMGFIGRKDTLRTSSPVQTHGFLFHLLQEMSVTGRVSFLDCDDILIIATYNPRWPWSNHARITAANSSTCESPMNPSQVHVF